MEAPYKLQIIEQVRKYPRQQDQPGEEICLILDKLKPSNESYLKQISFVKDRLGHDRRYAINSSKIQNKLGWKPSVDFDEGLRMTVNWYLKNFDWLCKKNI